MLRGHRLATTAGRYLICERVEFMHGRSSRLADAVRVSPWRARWIAQRIQARAQHQLTHELRQMLRASSFSCDAGDIWRRTIAQLESPVGRLVLLELPTRTGAGGSGPLPPCTAPKPEPEPQPQNEITSDSIAIYFVDENGDPVEGVEYVLELSGGRRIEGKTKGENPIYENPDLPPGSVELQFINIPDAHWQLKESKQRAKTS